MPGFKAYLLSPRVVKNELNQMLHGLLTHWIGSFLLVNNRCLEPLTQQVLQSLREEIGTTTDKYDIYTHLLKFRLIKLSLITLPLVTLHYHY